MNGRIAILYGLLTLLCLLPTAETDAQTLSRARRSTFGQEVPPFLREAPTPTTAVVDGRTRVIPRFTSGINPKVYSPLMLQPAPYEGLLKDYARALELHLPLTYPYLENFGDTPNPLPVLNGLRGPNARLDFRRSAPHLAFFCRLEINEARGNIIPAKFRLGGHRHWQDDLRRRD